MSASDSTTSRERGAVLTRVSDPKQSGGGPLRDIASHRIDLMNYLFGKPVRAIGHLSTLVQPLPVEDNATLMMLAMGVWSIGALMLARPFLQRWLQRIRVWTAVVFTNGIVMTLFLWHMTAYLLAVLTLSDRSLTMFSARDAAAKTDGDRRENRLAIRRTQ